MRLASKNLFLVLVGVPIGALIFYGGLVILDNLSSDDNEPVIVVVNDSKSVLNNALLSVNGMPDSGPIDSLQPHDYLSQYKPAGRKVAFRLVFDARGRHYEFPGEAKVPFYARNMAIRVDDTMQISVHAR